MNGNNYNNNNYNNNNNNFSNNNNYNNNNYNNNFRNNKGCINLDELSNYDKNEFNKANSNFNNINELDDNLDNFYNDKNKDDIQNENQKVNQNEDVHKIKNTIDNNKYKEKVKLKKNINENLIKTMAILYDQDISSRKGDIKSYFTSLYYKNNFSKNFEYNSNHHITIFNQGLNSSNKDEIDSILKTFLYFSYRTGFIDLKVVGCESSFTSDCGWGCMLRCSQMILSKAFIENKIMTLKKQGQYINNSIIDKIREEVLALFNDNYLNIEDVTNHPDYQYFWALYEKFAQNNPKYQSIQKIVPPFSIHILCKLGNCAGEFTSDMNMINVISRINSDILDEFNIISFTVGNVKLKTLIKEFCEEITDFENVNNADIITCNGIDYKLKKPGIIFISFRLGVDLLGPNYYNDIPKIFNNFRNNLGIIGGIKKRAYYFIGVQDNKLIFVDPHYTQETKDNKEKNIKTYLTKHLYLLDIKEMRCQFSLAIGVFDAQQFNQFLEDVKWFSQNTKDFIKLE